MAKRQSFADKVAHAQAKGQHTCPVCGNALQTVKWVTSEMSARKAYRFSQKMVNVCKCNNKEIYG